MPRAALLEYGTHLVDLMRAVLGEPQRTFALAHKLNPQVRGESLVHVTYEYAQAIAVVEIAWKNGGLPQGGLSLVGDDGEILYEGTLTRGRSARYRKVHRQGVVADEIRIPTDDYVDSFFLFQRDWVKAVQSGDPFAQTGAEAVKTLGVTLAPYRSIEERRVVSFDEPSSP
jgi:predicted dehydrogenase